MTYHTDVPLHRVAESLGWQGDARSKSQTQTIRSIQRSRNEEPCFASDQVYICEKDCEWLADCRAMLAVWVS